MTPGEPLARANGRIPVLYSALGAVLHLEKLGPEDGERLDRACDLLWDWMGASLRLTLLSCAPEVEATRRAHLDYISSYAESLDVRAADDPSTQKLLNNLTKMGRNDHEVLCGGGDDPREASPFSLHFWSEIGGVSPTDLRLPAYPVLSFTVPDAWPLDDFYQRTTAIAAELRLRWGAAGYTYAGFGLHAHNEPEQRRYAHARRYPGYDVAQYVRMVQPFYARIRTVSWLTFLGASMVEQLQKAGQVMAPVGGVDVRPHGDGVLLRAGGAPERGDVNRLNFPAAYRAADALVRPLRAADGRGMTFLGPWDEASITEWLRRFEHRVS
ncbi:MAG: DUF3396 domain-containing protein [Byssovorax sp.]